MEANVVVFRDITYRPTLSNDKFVVLVGNLSRGYEVYGPFESLESACRWEEENSQDLAWPQSWVMKLNQIKEAIQ